MPLHQDASSLSVHALVQGHGTGLGCDSCPYPSPCALSALWLTSMHDGVARLFAFNFCLLPVRSVHAVSPFPPCKLSEKANDLLGDASANAESAYSCARPERRLV